MKIFSLTILLLCLAGAAFAHSETPLKDYYNNPDTDTYRNAVDKLSQSIAAGEGVYKAKVNLAYIADYEAQRLIDELLLSPDSLATGERFSLANMLLAREDFAQATKLYDALNKDFPQWSCPWRHKGEALYKQKDFSAAEQALQQAIATNLEHYDAYVWMAFTLNELGRYTEALQNLEKAMTLSPEAEESQDEVLSQEHIQQLYTELKKKAH